MAIGHPLTLSFIGGIMAQRQIKQSASAWDGIEQRRWHFDKRLSLDTIVGILGISLVIGGPFLVWGRAMESRVLSLETIAAERMTMEKQRDEASRDLRQATEMRVSRMDEKLTNVQVTLAQIQAGIEATRNNGRRDK
jgi:hypothetical protein